MNEQELKVKTCTACGETKEIDEFYKTIKRSEKRGEFIYYLPRCKECLRKQHAKYRQEKEESYRKAIYKYQRSDKARNGRRRRSKKYRKQGKLREWQNNNKDRVKHYNEDRRHKNHDITSEEWEACKKYFNYSCAYCGMTYEEHKEKYNQDLHKEHADHNGASDLSNCIPACRECNSSKHDFDLQYWYKERSNIFNEERLNKIIKWLKEDYKKHIK